MISEYLPKSKKWFFINIIGIAIAFATVLFVSSYTTHELSYDKFHSKADDIYRINIENSDINGLPKTSQFWGKYMEGLYDNFPEIKEVVRIIKSNNSVITIGQEKFTSNHLYFTNKEFFKLFDFKLLHGNKLNLFSDPNQVAISKDKAISYFGTTDILGKEIKIKEQYSRSEYSYTIAGVMENFPENSHFKADFLFSLGNYEDKKEESAHTYLLLEKGSKAEELKKSIENYYLRRNESDEPALIVQIMPLNDIHLYSNSVDELRINGSISSLITLVIGVFIVSLIAFINHTNLSYVQFVTDLKNFKIRIVNGASLTDLAQIIIVRSILQTSFAILIGALLVYLSNSFSSFFFDITISISAFVIISIIFYVLFAIAALLPLLTKQVSKELSVSPTIGSKKFIVSLVFQFFLSITAIIITIVLHRQIDFVKQKHPGYNQSEIVVIHDVPFVMISKYEIFKEALLQNPNIKNVSAAFYKPGLNIPYAYPIEMEGIEPSEEKKLTAFSIDPDFFKLFNINPIAGSLDMGITSDIEWEKIAIGIHGSNPGKDLLLEKLDKYNKEHSGFKEKYILNTTALKVLGIRNPQDAIGKEFKFNFEAPEMFQKGEVIAVIDELHYGDLFSKEEPLVIAAKKLFNSTFIVKIDPNRKSESISILKDEWHKLAPNNPLQYEFINDLYAKIYRNQNNEMKALTLFAVLSILLSMLGMFALSSYSILHKTKEIGIRKANGASSIEILIELIFEYLKWVIFAFVIACPIAYYISRDWLNNFAYKIELSWWFFALAVLISIIITIITVSWQTYNAARKDPVYALKYE
ncbi:MAG: ABC transporter permease [Marinifilum sp.]|jgi:putative ABC transport system permease protein|nr:ABC transporter permease [Marinifilum sp.]